MVRNSDWKRWWIWCVVALCQSTHPLIHPFSSTSAAAAGAGLHHGRVGRFIIAGPHKNTNKLTPTDSFEFAMCRRPVGGSWSSQRAHTARGRKRTSTQKYPGRKDKYGCIMPLKCVICISSQRQKKTLKRAFLKFSFPSCTWSLNSTPSKQTFVWYLMDLSCSPSSLFYFYNAKISKLMAFLQCFHI